MREIISPRDARRISLIIPCYRDAATIARALDSVSRQTRPVDEVILVNDCSPETQEIEQVLQAYPHILYIKNPVNIGLAATRNRGVSAADGDVVTFLDADDELHPQKIEFQVRMLRENSAVACGVRRVAATERIDAHIIYPKLTCSRIVTSTSRMLFTNYLTGASIMIAKDLMVKIGGYDATLRSCEDYDLWLRLLEAGVTVYDIRLPLYVYHYNEDGLSNNYLNVSYWELEVLRKYFARNQSARFESVWDACIWAFWMLKHLVRYERVRDKRLQVRTMENIELLSKHPLLAWPLKVISRSHALKLYTFMR